MLSKYAKNLESVSQPRLISLIITTYNNPAKLLCVLNALSDQSDMNFEVIVVDDGSTSETQSMVEEFEKNCCYPLRLVWQPDNGFRASRSRNLGIKASDGDYIVFLDGDCIPLVHFIRCHRQLAEPGFFVSGHRVLLSPLFSQKIEKKLLRVHAKSSLHWLVRYLLRSSNKLCVGLVLGDSMWRKRKRHQWEGVKSCNLGVWKQDLISVSGFDESFLGWGYEDSDLVIRLIRLGLQRKIGKYAVEVLHLWHLEESRDRQSSNQELLSQVLSGQRIKALDSVLTNAVVIPSSQVIFRYMQ